MLLGKPERRVTVVLLMTLVLMASTSIAAENEPHAAVMVDASILNQRFCLGADSELETAFLDIAFRIRNGGPRPLAVCASCLRILSISVWEANAQAGPALSRQEPDFFVLKRGKLTDRAFVFVGQGSEVIIKHEVVVAVAKRGLVVPGYPGDGTYSTALELSVSPFDADRWAARFRDKGDLLRSKLEARFTWPLPTSRQGSTCEP